VIDRLIDKEAKICETQPQRCSCWL